MAIIALVFGSFFGFFGAVTGWLVMDISAASAFGLYVGSSLVIATLMLSAQVLRSQMSPSMAQTA